MKNATDGHEWAQIVLEKMLPICLHGPIIAAERYADGHKWAQCCYQDLLLMQLNGPIIVAEISC